jgi:hypothetical protein
MASSHLHKPSSVGRAPPPVSPAFIAELLAERCGAAPQEFTTASSLSDLGATCR